ncbi:MAG TPA: hypothetical protein VGM44_01005 [Polyangiaceae bacterium]
MSRAHSLIFGCLFLPACSVASVPETPSTIAQNECTTSDDCSNGGVCDDERCHTTSGTFTTLLFQVTPPADASPIAGVSFLLTCGSGSAATQASCSGAATANGTTLGTEGGELDLSLDLVAQISGQVIATRSDCVPKFLDDRGNTLAAVADGSIPALISLTPSAGSLGLFASPAVAQAALSNQISWTFSLNVPPGQYDIYVQPPPQPDTSCPSPPQLLLGQTIKSGILGLEITMPPPSSFDLHVSWPLADGALAGWTADILDPTSGRVISNSVPLSLEKGGKSYIASLSYLPVTGIMNQVAAQELVRLSPPNGLAAPTVLLSRGALSLFSANSGTLSQFTALPLPVDVKGQVTAEAMATPAAASVTFVASQLDGVDPGVLASFVRTAQAGADGQFDVVLLPGTYRVSAVPAGAAIVPGDTGKTPLAPVSVDWRVAASPSVQAGKVIELGRSLAINGAAFDLSGTPLAGAQVQAVASPASIAADVLHVALGEAAFVPLATSALIAGDGSFSIYADPGTFDFSVQPQANTGFPWLVIPSLGVATNAASSGGPALGSIAAPWPVLYTGTLSVPGASPNSPQPVPGALIRTFVYLHAGAYTADATQADSVLQIAESRSDSHGAYQLLIPASLNAPPHM